MHPILGNIIRDTNPCEGLATITYKNGSIRVSFDTDGSPYDAVVEFAASVVSDLSSIDAKAKEIAASQLTETYNDGWNRYDELQEDGTYKEISHPQLTPEEFARKLTLYAISVTGDEGVTFFYNDERMFWGHSVTVDVFDKLDFTRAHAGIFG